MSYKIKSIIILFTLLIMAFSCHSQRNKHSQTNKSLYKIDAHCYPYITAMGKGKGIVFRIIVLNNNDSNFNIESYYLNNKPMEFTVVKQKGIVIVETNYLKNNLTTGFLNDDKLPTIKEIDDPIILEQKYYPSWLIINGKNGKIKLEITNYKTQE